MPTKSIRAFHSKPMLLINSFSALPTKNHIFLLECIPTRSTLIMVQNKNE
jgi:hypothetical protein